MRILVLRTSAMGDVALVVPVLSAFRKQYPDAETIFVTRKSFNAFFSNDLQFTIYNPEFGGRHKGLTGIFRLYKDLSAFGTFDHVLDLHNVLRTRLLRFLFRIRGTAVTVIDKGRKEKRKVISGKQKEALKHTVYRYCDVFSKAGLPIEPPTAPSIKVPESAKDVALRLTGDMPVINIGIAPFALHQLKMWPQNYLRELITRISERHKVKFWFFGSPAEHDLLQSLAALAPGSANLSGKLTLEEELAVMNRLDFMIAMDSSNMHMAALVGTKVISIWGGTDPINGFGAWMQPKEYSISIPVNVLTCRPCTVYGKGRCSRGDFACMNWLTPEIVYQKIRSLKLLS